MIEFYPRDIGLWRNLFDFDEGRVTGFRPCKHFNNREELTSFILEHFPASPEDNEKYPVKFIEEDNNYGITHTVQRWTVVGWITELAFEIYNGD